MGQKVHPRGMRLGIIHTWKAHWYNERNFADLLAEDLAIRGHIQRKLGHAGLSDIIIRKDTNKVVIDIFTARPGIVIGKSGSEVDALRRDIHGMTGKNVQVNITEIKRPELDASLVAQSIAEQLSNRVSFRRAMKRAITSAMRSGPLRSRSNRVVVWVAPKWRGWKATAKGGCRCTRSALTSITVSAKPTPLSGRSA